MSSSTKSTQPNSSTDQPVTNVIQGFIDKWSSLGSLFSEYFSIAEQKKAQFLEFKNSFQIEETKQGLMGFLEAMNDLTPISNINAMHFIELFMISCIFIFVSWIGTIIGSTIAPLFLSFVFLDFGAFIMAIIVIPMIATQYFNEGGLTSLSSAKRQIVAATFVLEQGIILGFINRQHNFNSPLLFITQAVASFVVPLTLSRFNDRPKVFGIVIGTTVLAQLLIGLSFGHLSFGYFFLSIIYSFFAIFFIQFTIISRLRIDFDDVFFTMHYVFILAVIKSLGLILFGSTDGEKDIKQKQK
ncbi:unnamed protein product [Caenorhabditis angaria]|uniref:Uncharacterized protein n=1 Tax=Caenorhabditis angaria TaxID=860376 RepID=A0A9P1IAW0_9PELO|nr:unnamed protein product [Caenorhabditis angaria]